MTELKIIVSADDLLAVSDAARLLNIHRTTLYRWVNKGYITSVRIGNSTLISKNEINRLKERRTSE